VGILNSEQDVADLEEAHLRDIFTFAGAAAAITATGEGAIPSLPGREEVEELLTMGDWPWLPEAEAPAEE